ncbi:Serine/threonine-protein phosphatase 4 regulatory subunit 3 [Spathaspora sp. JA1]|nr:Serine/threonine-protein phosphatase 4 regulatory subunit 3 [Spathaspora sp. JA1]
MLGATETIAPIDTKYKIDAAGSVSQQHTDKFTTQLPGRTPRRVKVYLLNGDDWIDNGTGYCVGDIDAETKCPYFLVRSEAESNQIILKSFLEGSIQFQRQQETLIVWTDLTGKDLALSFQETEGCADLCEFIVKVQQANYSPNISLYFVIPNSSVDGGEDITELITGPITYPPDPTEENLSKILEVINQGSNSQYSKTNIVKFIIDENFFNKLVNIFNKAENLKQLNNLYTLSEIVKSLFLYNEKLLVEDFLQSEEKILALVGMLEYDSEYPKFKACHRDFLQRKSFKSIIPIDNIVIFKKDFHLNFLKDVVLPRVLDDQTFNMISTLIYINQVEIINYLKDSTVLQPLFEIYKSNSTTSDCLKRDGVQMLHQYILIAKSLQSHLKLGFFSLLVRNGLFKMISFALQDSQDKIRILGTELIVIIIEQDVSLVHSIENEETIDNSEPPTHPMIEEEEEHDDEQGSSPGDIKLKLSDDMTLISILTNLLVEDKNPGLKIQAVEALRILLDSNIANVTKNGSGTDFDEDSEESSDEGINDFKDINTKNYFRAFYTQVAPILFRNIIQLSKQENISSNKMSHSDELLYQHLCDLISFCTREHKVHISRPFFLENNILLGIAKLLDCNCKLPVKLSVLRCLKNIIILNDNFYCRYIINNKILSYFFKFFQSVIGENTLANSTCLDLIEIIVKNFQIVAKKLNYKLLVKHIYSNYRKYLETSELEFFNSARVLLYELGEANGLERKCDDDSDDDVNDDDSQTNTNIIDNGIKTDELSLSDQEILQASTPINDEDDDYIENGNTDLESPHPEKRPREEDDDEEEDGQKAASSPPPARKMNNIEENNNISIINENFKSDFSNTSQKIALSTGSTDLTESS